MAQDMGLGILGSGDTVFKRKFRWTMEFQGVCGIDGQYDIPPNFVKNANRPSLTIGETEINYLNGKMWIPGKGTPDTTQVTFFDVASQAGAQSISGLFTWLATVYDFTNATTLTQSSAQNVEGGYTAKVGILKMLDGCGEVIDGFAYLNPWPTTINFGELDYATEDECTIECTFRYRNFEYFTSNGRCSTDFYVYCAGCGTDGRPLPNLGNRSLESITSVSAAAKASTPDGGSGGAGNTVGSGNA